MDNELDFRVGDVVCDIRFGTGKIDEIETGRNWPVCVNFGKARKRPYGLDGRYYDGEHRSLYHGTWEQVFGNLPDLKPRRKVKRWLNVKQYNSSYGSPEVYGYLNESEDEARQAASPHARHILIACPVEVDE